MGFARIVTHYFSHGAWELAQVWPGSELIVLGTFGHTSSDLLGHVVAATDRFAPP